MAGSEMQCTVIKIGQACTFATTDGCGFGAADETCNVVIDKCEGCGHIQEWPTGRYCGVFVDPAEKWNRGICNFATEARIEQNVSKKKVNPLKASKKAGRR